MKRAKIMLMAIAVLAVVGGALAFKASKFRGQVTVYGCTTTLIDNQTVTGCYQPVILTHKCVVNHGDIILSAAVSREADDCHIDPSQCSTFVTDCG